MKSASSLWLNNATILVLFALTIAGCKSSRNAAVSDLSLNDTAYVPFEVMMPPARYHGSMPLDWDLIHMSLEFTPVWQNQTIQGKSVLSMHPHFYEQDSLQLDARCMSIGGVRIGLSKEGLSKTPFQYQGDSLIVIPLSKSFTKKDTLFVEIVYTARPEQCEVSGSAAITSDKGFFFIDPLDKIPYKPRQFWTQGETRYNSRWFPTIESPNQRITHDITITVEEGFTTLSNGELVKSTRNPDGTRSDRWEMKQAHSVYLVMVAAGTFKKVSQTWKGKEVSYYVEPGYEPYALDIFGNTPEMMTFFSDLLDYPYPWNKYSQIVVRDFVSGAMENTTATTIHESIQKTKKELQDEPMEELIAHELFHHWFGDLVTCESWANLPLNESFATYGEYLWLEYKYGFDAAEEHRHGDFTNYLQEAMQKWEPLFRPYYYQEEDMFDALSYQKGGLVLHYLRKVAGDEAFFASIRHYLKARQHQSAEIDHLRQSFEEVTGKDWRWFFDQWFYYPGYPELSMVYSWSEESKKLEVTIDQIQMMEQKFIYKLPTEISIVTAEGISSHPITVSNIRDVFTLPCKSKPVLVVLDPNCLIPGYIRRDTLLASSMAILNSFKGNAIKLAALNSVSPLTPPDQLNKLALRALQEPAASLRVQGLQILEDNPIETENSAISAALKKMVASDKYSVLRSNALAKLNKQFKGDEELWQINLNALEDNSYMVQAEALIGLHELDPELGLKRAKQFEADSNLNMVRAVAIVYGNSGNDSMETFFLRNAHRINSMQVMQMVDFLQSYGSFIIGRNDSIINRSIPFFEEVSRQNQVWTKIYATSYIGSIKRRYERKKDELEASLSKGGTDEEINAIKKELTATTVQLERVHALLESLIETEPDIFKDFYRNGF